MRKDKNGHWNIDDALRLLAKSNPGRIEEIKEVFGAMSDDDLDRMVVGDDLIEDKREYMKMALDKLIELH